MADSYKNEANVLEGPLTEADVYAVIGNERAYQDAIWCAATTPTEGKHSPTEFLVYIGYYLDKAKADASNKPDPIAKLAILDSIRKVAALAVSCMEQNGAVTRDPAHFPITAARLEAELNDEIPF